MPVPVTLREATMLDLVEISSWLRSAEDCRLWAGERVVYPLEPSRLPQAIEFEDCDSLALLLGAELIAFGQIIPKASGRLHLARLIVSPKRRASGWGRRLAETLLARALEAAPSSISLNVARDNEAAVKLYRSLGFEESPRPRDEAPSEALYLGRDPEH